MCPTAQNKILFDSASLVTEKSIVLCCDTIERTWDYINVLWHIQKLTLYIYLLRWTLNGTIAIIKGLILLLVWLETGPLLASSMDQF